MMLLTYFLSHFVSKEEEEEGGCLTPTEEKDNGLYDP